MGQKSSRQKQQAWAQQPFGFQPNPYGPNAPFLPPGYQPTPGPYAPNQPGFIPPGSYGQAGMAMPQPQLSFMPNDKPKKDKDKKGKKMRPQSEQFQGGFAGTGMGLTFPEQNVSNGPVIPKGSKSGRRRASASAAGPSSSRIPGTPAPVIPPRTAMMDDEEDSFSENSSDSESTGPPRTATPYGRGNDYHRRARSENSHQYPQVTGRIDDVLRPLSPASRSAFGPSGPRRVSESMKRNPLPPPPRDLYEMSPYKNLLTLPQTTALLTATYGTQHQQTAPTAPVAGAAGAVPGAVQATTLVIPHAGQGPAAIVPPGAQIPGQVLPQQGNLKKSGSQKKKSRVSGLMRALSGKRKKEETQIPPQAAIIAQPAKVQFVPVFVDSDKKPGAPSVRGSVKGIMKDTQANTSAATSGANVSQGSQPAPSIRSRRNSGVPPMGALDLEEDDTTVRFDQLSGRFQGFMNHSPHRVRYEGQDYPTATHLFEAMRFLPDYPHAAEAIRTTANVQDVYPVGATFAELQRDDWPEVWMDRMKDAVYLKFRQHPDLRYALVGTGDKKLVYADVLDGFWGVGPNGTGENELGKVLMWVREQLKRETQLT